jgi:hypothetical protein
MRKHAPFGNLQLTHGREVEGTDSGNNAQGQPDARRVHVLGDLDALAFHHVRDSARRVDDLEPAEDVSHGVGMGLALLEHDVRRDL